MKRLLSILLLAAVAVACTAALPVETEAAAMGYYTYSIIGGKATITSVSSAISGNVTIPSTFGGYTVTGIGNYAFNCCTRVTSVTIPESVNSISNRAFYYCTNLTEIRVDENNPNFSSDSQGILYDKEKTTLIQAPDTITSCRIPDSVTSIGEDAFYYCNRLTSIQVGKNNTAFSSDSQGILYDKGKTTLIQAPDTITSCRIPNTVTSIGKNAFADCTKLTEVTVPDKVTDIGDWAFYRCTGLTDINIPDRLTKIGDCAFYSCTSLTELTIPDRVTSIGNCAFYYCAELTAISIPDSLVSIGNNAFADCAKLTDITLPNGVTDIGNFAFSGCNLLTIHCEEGSEAENYAKKSGIPIAYIGAVTHAHDYASDWTTDENSHWHPCSGCEEKGDYAAHAWNDGEVTKEATETETGLKKYTCTVCGATKEETLDKLDVTANQGRNPPEDKFPWWIVIVPIVVIGGGAAAILFLKKKKKA